MLNRYIRVRVVLSVACFSLVSSYVYVYGQRLSDEMSSEMSVAVSLMESHQDSAMTISWDIWRRAEATDDLWLMGVVRSFLAYQGAQVGDIEMGYMNFRSALDLLIRADTLDYYNLSIVFGNLGIIHADFNDNERAIEYFEQALNYTELYLMEYPDGSLRKTFRVDRDSYLFSIAVERSKSGDFMASQEILLRLLNDEMSDNVSLRDEVLNELGIISMRLKEYSRSREYFLEVINNNQVDEIDKGNAYHNLGTVSSQLNDWEEAKGFYRLALETSMGKR